jgi:signal recognition particle subunit SRP54
MLEMAEIKRIADPHEILLVVDALTGQDAVNLARSFDERVGITGIVMTRMDGDGRGGAALSMRAVTGKPIKLLGVGEKSDALEDFDPSRIAGRILGMGDIVALVEKAAAEMDMAKAAKMAAKLKQGSFDLDDLAEQLRQMQKMGGMKGIMGMMPGMGKMAKQLEGAQFDDKIIKRQIAIISSMTKQERAKPDVLAASRKRRVAAGSGTRVEDINRLLKQHRQMADMMKSMKKGGRGGLGGLLGGLMGGGMPQIDPAMLEEMAKSGQMPPGMPGGMPGMPTGLPASPPTGLPPRLPGLPGLPGLGAKGPGGFLPGLGKKK